MSRFGLLGRSLAHSYSPLIHGLLADYDYSLFEVEPEDLAEFLLEEDFGGLNVTIPYKVAVMEYCSQLSARARAVGSVNTIVRQADGSLWGDNTDVLGFAWMLGKSGIEVSGKKVLVLGSGGAALAVQCVLKEAGASQILTISRRGEDNYDNLEKHRDGQVIINTTPVGMYPHNGKAPVDLKEFPHCEGVLDLIYNPARTQLLMDAEGLGIPCLGGLSMLVGQARAAAEYFSGAAIDQEKAQSVVEAVSLQMENIILIGMPGSGKTTVGRLVAEKLHLQYVDADQEVERLAGCSISTLFEQEGESGFRRRESAVLEQLGKGSGQLIATGGGCVTREENYAHLHQNGRIFFLQREIHQLDRQGRPLSQGTDLGQMYAQRLPLYQRFADYTIDNNGRPEEAAEKICEVLHEVFCH